VTRKAAPVLCSFVVALLALIGCGDNGSSSSSTSSTRPGGQIATTKSPGGSAPSTTGSGGNDVQQAKDAYTAFFNGADPNIDKKVALLQDGEKYRQMLVDAAADPRFQQLKADVRSARNAQDTECAAMNVPSPCAVVTFDLLLNGLPALAAHDGPAFTQNGQWKVGAKAWCDVVAIGGESCPA
jgi:hypothetical protein